MKTKVSCLCLSANHSAFYVGYMSSGVVGKYKIDTGMPVCSTVAHSGDVHTLSVVHRDTLCTSGSDGQVRLIVLKSDNSATKTLTEQISESYFHDELLYRRMSNGVLSLRLVHLQPNPSTNYLLVCLSSLAAPRLVNVDNKFDFRALNLQDSDDIGTYDYLFTSFGCCVQIIILIPVLTYTFT